MPDGRSPRKATMRLMPAALYSASRARSSALVSPTHDRCGRRYLYFAFQLQHGVQRTVAGRTTGTIGAGEEVRVAGSQLAGYTHQLS